MAGEDINPNVVLTANNAQYDNAMQASGGYTSDLAKGIDSLGSKLDNLSKSAGRKLLGISAADTAAVVGATAAWAAYEKQMSRLQAQAAVVGRGRDAEQKTMKTYTESVRGLRKEYGTTTGEAAALTQSISKMADQTKPIKDLSSTFVQMSNATGESAVGLSQSVLNLQKVMGTPQRNTEKYADQLTTLAAGANTSAAGLADFASQIAPVGRLIGLNQTAITGVSTAFVKAGQDGNQAATAFSQIVSGIAQATASGNQNDLAKYANLIGTTVESFQSMSGQDQIVSIFDRLSELGPKASVELNRLGLDGVRTMRAITAVTNQTGGIGAAIRDSQDAFGNGAVAQGSKAGMKGITDDLAKLRQELQMTGESFASLLGPGLAALVTGVEKVAGAFNDLMNGPLGKIAGLLGAALIPVTALGGGLLIMAGTILKVAAAFTALRNSGSQGIREGFSGASRLVNERDDMGRITGITNQADRQFGRRGRQLRDNGTFIQRGLYNAGNLIGGTARVGTDAIGGSLNMTRNAYRRANGLPDAPGRGIFGNIVGGAAGLSGAFLRPQLDQMRYGDPTKRSTFMGRFMPGANVSPDASTGTDGRTGASMRDLVNQYRDKDAAERVRTASTGATAAREAAKLSGAFGGAALGLGRFTTSLAAATAGIVARNRFTLGAAGATAGTLLMASGAAEGTGFQNTLGMSVLGGSIGGPWGAAAGAAGGLALDAAQANNTVRQSSKDYENLNDATLSERRAALDANLTQYDEFNKSANNTRSMNPGDWIAVSKNKWEGVFGKSDVEEEGEATLANTNDYLNQRKALMALARESGTEITGTSEKDRAAQLDEFAATLTPTMDKMGLTLDDLGKAAQAQEGLFAGLSEAAGGTYKPLNDLVNSLIAPGKTDGLWDRIAGSSDTNERFIESRATQQAIATPGDANLQYKAVNSAYADMINRGMSTSDIQREMGGVRAMAGDESSPEYMLAAGVQQQARTQMQFQLPTMSSTQQFGAQVQDFRAAAAVPAGDPNQEANMQEAMNGLLQAAEQQRQKFAGLLLQQREFNVSMSRGYEDFAISRERMDTSFNLQRSRAQEDFSLQRRYQEQDYQLSRRRAEFDFKLQRERGEADFTRSMMRGREDFNLSRKRQEEDYQHSVMLMQEQAAQQLYNIYERIEVKRTSSAEYLLVNAQDQLTRMREQAQNLDQVRGMGLSDNAIQQMGFTDSNNAQQLERFVSEVRDNPALIKQFNRAVKARIDAAGKLVTDESSKDWEEFRRQYKISRERAADDFEKQVTRSHRDFQRQMRQMETDFQRSMDRQATDYETSQQRQQEAFSLSMKRAAHDYAVSVDNMTQDFNKSMNRAKQDMNRAAREITGSLQEILQKSTEKLDGTAQRQAQKVLKTFQGLSGTLGPEANDIMAMMAKIFGFEFERVSANKDTTGKNPSLNKPRATPGAQMGMADGGTLPGRSIGRDNMKFYSKEHGELNLAGGEAIMVPEWVDKVGGPTKVREMNDNARAGRSFAKGGVFWPVPGHDTGTYPGHTGVDINRGSGWDDFRDPVRAVRSGTVSYVGRGRGYGNLITIHTDGMGTEQYYGHLDSTSVTQGMHVAGGQQIGRVGNEGNSSHPHLHFEVRPGGTTAAALAFLNGAVGGDFGTQGGGGQAYSVEQLLKSVYPKVEKSAKDVKLLGGIFKNNFWSKKINSMAKAAWNRNGKKYGFPQAPAPQVSGGYGAAPPAPQDLTSNQNTVRRAMLAHPFPADNWPSLYNLMMGESGFRNTAQNPTSSAYGMFQFLDSTWSGYGIPKTSDPWLQSVAGMRYIDARYGDPKNAYSKWKSRSPHWYGHGGVFKGPQTIGVGERGPEVVLPLNTQGVNYLTELMVKTQAGSGGKKMATGHATPSSTNYYSYQIDRSTNFTGAITVQANDPAKFITQLKARNNVRAMAQASLGGIRI